MTSKNLFFKLVRQDFKKRIWCPILIFITYFLGLEVRILLETEMYIKDKSFDEITAFIRDYFFGRDALIMSAVTCTVALVCGISGYAYLHSRKQLDLYHSLPVSRSQLFWSKYVSGILQFFLPFLMHVLISAGIAVGRGAFTIGTIPSVVSYTGLQLIIFALAYSVSILAVGLTGNVIINILGACVLFVYSTVAAVLANILSDRFFQTYTTFEKRVMNGWTSEKVWCFSPLSMILKLFSRPDSATMEEAEKFFRYDTSYVWVLVAAAVVYSMAAYFIYLKRASEAAGKSIAFPAAEPVVKTMIVIPGSFFIAIFFSELSFNNISESWFLFGLVFGFAILCILMEIIFRLDIRGAFRHKGQFLFNAACITLVFIVLKYDVTGYDTYVPSDAQIQSCAVSIQQLMPLTQAVRLNDQAFYYLDADEYRMKNMVMQGNPSVMELARKAAKEQLIYRYFDYYEGIEESPEYVETLNRQENYRSIFFGYRLLNGKMVYREYIIDIADADTIRLLADIFDDSDYKLGSTPVFNDSWNVAFDILRCRSNFKRADIALTSDMQAKLIETYQREYMELTLDMVMNVIPDGTIDFISESRRGYTSYSGEMFIYPQFVETIALLREYGFDMEEKLTADAVESVHVRKDIDNSASVYYDRGLSRYMAESASVVVETTDDTTVEYTDKEEIQQILDSVVCEGYSWKISSFANFYDDLYLLNVSYNVEDSNFSSYRFIRGQIPDFIE